MSDELLKEIPKQTIKLDKDYELSPINWNVLSAIEREFEGGLKGISQQFEIQPISSLLMLLFIFLKPNHPELTREKLGSLITLKNQNEVMDILNKSIQELISGA